MSSESEKSADAPIVDYDEALRATHREAAATLVVAVLIALFFWGAIGLLHDVPGTSGGLPLWFWWAVPGGYLASIAGVVWLVRRGFRNFSLDLTPLTPDSTHDSTSDSMPEKPSRAPSESALRS